MLLAIPATVIHFAISTSIQSHPLTHTEQCEAKDRSIHFGIAAWSGPQSMTGEVQSLSMLMPFDFSWHIYILYIHIYLMKYSMAMICHQSLCTTCGIWITINDNYSVSPGHTSCSPLQRGHPSDVLPLLRFDRRFPFGFFGQSSGTTKPKGWGDDSNDSNRFSTASIWRKVERNDIWIHMT